MLHFTLRAECRDRKKEIFETHQKQIESEFLLFIQANTEMDLNKLPYLLLKKNNL